MRPLDPLCAQSNVVALLRGAPPEDVRTELGRLDGLDLGGAERAARVYAHGALALREGRLDDAHRELGAAAQAFAAAGEPEASALCACEAWLGAIRRGPRAVYADAIAALEVLAREPGGRLVAVVAGHYRAVAMRYSGQTEATLRALLEVFALSEGLLVERAQVLNSLGTLYVVLGAFGAAQAVLEHAADLNHQIGDSVSEAISYGQLGSAALGRGELEAARRYLQKQEWFASRVGDAFGGARALTLLGDLAIDLGRPDDALAFGRDATSRASSVSPPLGMWLAYSARTMARAKLELGEPEALAELEAARERFRRIGNQLGEALVNWDLARHAAQRAAAGHGQLPGGTAKGGWYATATAFAGLGLPARVAPVLRDARALASDAAERRCLDLAFAVAAQTYPHLATEQEVELVYSEPDVLAEIATRRIEGLRNVGRVAALTVATGGLFVAAVAARGIASCHAALPSARAAAALAGALPGMALWVWPAGTSASELARDLASLRAASGEDCRAAVAWLPEARVARAPFAGELGVALVGADCAWLYRAVLAAADGTLLRDPLLPWDGEAEGLARLGGYSDSRELER
ncbi:MAG: tetratricopeptide repeat protein [Myxococcales bacterium]|nr:tetratricopeptide repeat protein [Myxococcales bacterium]